MAAQRRGRAGGVAAERPLGRPDSELLLHPELLSEEFLLLTLEQVRPRLARHRGGPAEGHGPARGRGGEVGRGAPAVAVREVFSQALSARRSLCSPARVHQKHSGKK